MGVPGPGKKRESGFTLLEAIVVMTVLGIMAAVAIPFFAAWLPNYKLRGAAQDLYSNLQIAKMDAIKENGQSTIVFNQGPGTYTMTSPSGSFRNFTLSEYGYGISYVDPAGGDPITYPTNSVTFNSRGLIAGLNGWVKIGNNKGRFYQVGTLSSTGIIRLEKWNGSSWE